MTEYVVLQKNQQSGYWVELKGIYPARSARSAVQGALLAWPDDLAEGGDFVAVPARSFTPVTVKVETKTALKFS